MDEALQEQLAKYRCVWHQDENVVLLGNYETLQSAQPPRRFEVGVSTVRIGDEPV
jgi:hypothetical protein